MCLLGKILVFFKEIIKLNIIMYSYKSMDINFCKVLVFVLEILGEGFFIVYIYSIKSLWGCCVFIMVCSIFSKVRGETGNKVKVWKKV